MSADLLQTIEQGGTDPPLSRPLHVNPVGHRDGLARRFDGIGNGRQCTPNVHWCFNLEPTVNTVRDHHTEHAGAAMMNQFEKGEVFQRLHQRGRAFVIPNPWDIGSARMLAALGFEALATTSAGFAFSQGKLDAIGHTTRTQALDHARDMVNATSLPVSADLENGYGNSPEEVQATIRGAGEIGLVGCSIEDTSGDPTKPIMDKTLAIERIQAAVEVVRELEVPFMLTARAENYLYGRNDLDDTLARLQAFSAAGADVLYAPGLPDLDSIRTLCGAVDKPVNVVAGIRPRGVTVAELQDCGVRRISLGSALARVAIGATIDAAETLLRDGSFEAFDSAASFERIEALLSSAGDSAEG